MSIVIDSEDLDCSFREQDDFRITNEEDGGGGGVDHHSNNSSSMEQEKRLRREIANSNERRRMQSINAGFQSLKNLLPHHEGEKLSKAAILQQTAEYVYTLEQEKTHLLSQNCQLKRLIDQSEGGSEIQTSKKRKFDHVMTMQTISDSSDEGLGSMSPEPVNPLYTVLAKHPSAAVTPITSVSVKEYMELKHLLDVERRNRIQVEEQLRQLETEIYPERRDYSVQYQEVIEHTDNVREEEVAVSIIQEPTHGVTLEIEEIHNGDEIEVVQMETLPTLCQTQVVVCSTINDEHETIIPDSPIDDLIVHIKPDKDKNTTTTITTAATIPAATIITETIEIPVTTRLQPILEAAIKAEPKVEVERINSPATIKTIATDDDTAAPNTQRMYVTSTSRQNLETIVEAIRHLEGDSLFNDAITEQDAPLALTTSKPAQRQLQVEMNSFLQFRQTPNNANQTTSSSSATTTTLSSSSLSSLSSSCLSSSSSSTTTITSTPSHIISNHHLQQQCRPGVIVGKQSS